MSFVLFGTEGCHLCDDAAAVIVEAAQNLPVEIYQEDIADSEGAVETYGTRIPVLKNELTGAELDWPFAAEDVRRFIRESAEGSSGQ